MAYPVYEKKEDIPKGFEGEYEEVDGKWQAKDPAKALKTALDSERETRKVAEKAAEKAANDLRDLETTQAAAKKGVNADQLKQLREDVKGDLDKEYGPKLKKLEDLELENRQLRLDEKVKAMAAKQGVFAERLEDFFKLYGDDFDLTDDGEPMVKGKPGIDPAKRVAEQVKLQPGWVQGSKADGSGTGGDKTGGDLGTGKMTEKDLLAHPDRAIAAGNVEK